VLREERSVLQERDGEGHTLLGLACKAATSLTQGGSELGWPSLSDPQDTPSPLSPNARKTNQRETNLIGPILSLCNSVAIEHVSLGLLLHLDEMVNSIAEQVGYADATHLFGLRFTRARRPTRVPS
jgi:hypothetical protein